MARNAGVELIISAKDESEKAFAEVTDALKELEAAAKKGGGLNELFEGVEARLDRLSKKQRQVNQALSDASGVQRSIDAASRFTKVLEDQEKAAAKAQERLSKLEEEFAGIEAAANAAREPNERLAESLNKQQTRQAALAQRIGETTDELQRANAALAQNAGLDDRAAASIAKQEKAVIAAGQAWRGTTKAIQDANNSIRSGQAERDVLIPLRDQAAAQLKQLQSEFQRVQTLARTFQREASKEGSGGAIQSLARNATQRLAQLRTEIIQQKQVHTDLNKQLNTVNRSIERQTTLVTQLVDKAGQQKSVYQNLRTSLVEFNNAARAEGTQRQTANIERLQNSLVKLQTEYDNTSQKVEAAEQALASSMAPDPKAIAQRDAYVARIGEAITAVQREQKELARLKAEFNQAGISVDQLSARQKELDTVTENLTREQAKLKNETRELDRVTRSTGTGAKKLGEAFRLMGRDTRQSLSYLQRIRGELLSIAATYTGIYAVGGAIRSIYDASVQLNRAEARLGAVFEGDTEKVAEEINFIRSESDRLKVGFEGALDQYTKFIAAVPKGALPLEQIRYTFSGIAESARVAGLSTDDVNGVFVALTQIMSKGALSMEELRQQLGDRLPGALGFMAKGLGLTTSELQKLVAEGKIGSQSVVLLANELRKQYGPELNKALTSANASLAEFQNAIFELRLELAESGFVDVLVEGLREATAAIRSPEFRKGARQFATLLGELVKVAVTLIQNFDKLALAVKVVVGLMAARTVTSFVANIHGAGTAMVAFSKDAGRAETAAGKLVGRLGALVQALSLLATAAAAGFAFGTYLNEQFAPVQKFGVLMVATFEEIRIRVGTLWEKLMVSLDANFEDLIKLLGKKTIEFVRDTNKMMTRVLPDALGEPLRKLQDTIFDPERLGGETTIEKKFAEIDAKAEEARKNATDTVKQMLADIDAEFAKRDAKGPSILPVNQAKKDAAEIRKQIEDLLSDEEIAALREAALGSGSKELTKAQLNQIQAIRDALLKIDAEIQEKSAGTLQERLEAVRVEYAKLQRQIEAVSGFAQFPEAQASIEQVVAIKQVEETEKEINKLIQERRKLIDGINELNQLGAITVEEASQRINAENERILPQLTEALAVAREIASTVGSGPVTQSVDNQAQMVALEQERAKREQLLQIEAQINQALEIRAARVQTINALVAAGTLDEYNGRQQILEINRQTGDQLDELIQKATELAQSLGDPQMVERLKQVSIELGQVKEQLVSATEINESFASGLTNAIEGFIRGTMTAKEAFRSFIADFLVQIARAITQALILRAISSAFGGGGGLGGAIAGAVNHTGGVVGRTATKRRVPVAAFANAIRYHSGGIAGLKPNEVPTILEQGEEVLTRDDPRHQMNGGGNSSPVQLKIVNTIDSASVLNEALNSSAGQKTLVNAIRANKSSIKSVLN